MNRTPKSATAPAEAWRARRNRRCHKILQLGPNLAFIKPSRIRAAQKVMDLQPSTTSICIPLSNYHIIALTIPLFSHHSGRFLAKCLFQPTKCKSNLSGFDILHALFPIPFWMVLHYHPQRRACHYWNISLSHWYLANSQLMHRYAHQFT